MLRDISKQKIQKYNFKVMSTEQVMPLRSN